MRILYDKGNEKYCVTEVTSVWCGNSRGTTGLCYKTMEGETMIFTDVT